jgi:hypothetical protein
VNEFLAMIHSLPRSWRFGFSNVLPYWAQVTLTSEEPIRNAVDGGIVRRGVAEVYIGHDNVPQIWT